MRLPDGLEGPIVRPASTRQSRAVGKLGTLVAPVKHPRDRGAVRLAALRSVTGASDHGSEDLGDHGVDIDLARIDQDRVIGSDQRGRLA
jgi:hypothetical protein